MKNQKTTLFPNCEPLLGFKGKDMDTGSIYCPYVPITMEPNMLGTTQHCHLCDKEVILTKECDICHYRKCSNCIVEHEELNYCKKCWAFKSYSREEMKEFVKKLLQHRYVDSIIDDKMIYMIKKIEYFIDGTRWKRGSIYSQHDINYYGYSFFKKAVKKAKELFGGTLYTRVYDYFNVTSGIKEIFKGITEKKQEKVIEFLAEEVMIFFDVVDKDFEDNKKNFKIVYWIPALSFKICRSPAKVLPEYWQIIGSNDKLFVEYFENLDEAMIEILARYDDLKEEIYKNIKTLQGKQDVRTSDKQIY